jgi:hypothetical protein
MLAPRDRIAGVMLGAADYIERHGWCQGASTIDSRVCAAWAMTIAADYDYTTSEHAGRRLMRSLGIGGTVNRTVPAWNDKIGRTREEVVEALRSAAFAPA